MFNPHPPLSHFPPAIAGLLLLLELYELLTRKERSSVRNFLIIALACALPLTYISGYWGISAANAPDVYSIAPDLIEVHQTFALAASLCAFPLVIFGLFRGSDVRGALVWCYRLTLFVFVLLTFNTAHRGGELVFEHGAAVRVQSTSN